MDTVIGLLIITLVIALGISWRQEQRYRRALQEINFKSSWMTPGKFGDAYVISCRALQIPIRNSFPNWAAKKALNKKASTAAALDSQSTA